MVPTYLCVALSVLALACSIAAIAHSTRNAGRTVPDLLIQKVSAAAAQVVELRELVTGVEAGRAESAAREAARDAAVEELIERAEGIFSKVESKRRSASATLSRVEAAAEPDLQDRDTLRRIARERANRSH